MSVKFTDSQLKAINANGTVLVAAAAGSGKTAVLVERIIRRFCDETSPLMADRALIVTFTNAAADELKSKIETKLKEKLLENPDSDLLKRQNMAFKRATISTIDSFCIAILRENFNLLNISRDFKINDSTNIEAEIDLMLDKFIFDKFSSKNETLLEVASALKSGFDDWYLKKVIKTIYKKSRAMPYPQNWLDEIYNQNTKSSENFNDSDWAKFTFEKLTILVNKALKSNKKLKEISLSGSLLSEKHLPLIENRLEFLECLKFGCTEHNWNECVETYRKFNYSALRSNYSKDPYVSNLISESNTAIKSSMEFLEKNLSSKLEDIEYILSAFNNVLSGIIKLIKEFDDYVYEISIQNNTFTFDQIEHLTLKLFSSEENSAIENFNSMFDAILVDEYQDTSNLQDELFSLLSKQKKELFMVGDVKQSIYGFRNANPDNFLKKKELFPLYNGTENPCKVLLTGNFRSRKGICDFINYVFSAYMTKSDADMDYNEEEALVPLGNFAENNESSDVEIKLLENDSCFSTNEYEANYVADYILDTLKKDAFIDDGNNGLRRAEFKDFALLMRSPGSRLNTFVEVFKSRGIPVNCPTESFKDSAEIKVALAFLKALNNVNDDISFLTVLKSPLYNFSDEEIADIVSQDRYTSLYYNLKSVSDSIPKAHCFVSQFDKLRMYSAIYPLNKLLNLIYSETFMIEIYSSMENGEIKQANLRVLLDIASKFTVESGKGIKEMISYIESDSSNTLAVNISNSNNAVQITSIHKSKGLQYPICILCSAQTRFNLLDTSSQVVCDDNLGASFTYYDKRFNSQLTPISSRFISDGMKSKLYKEELRLLYVALTRAKDKLVVVSTVKDIESYLGKMTNYSLEGSLNGIPFKEGTLSNGNSYSDWIISAALYHRDGVAFRRGDVDFNCSHYDCNFNFSTEAPDLINVSVANTTETQNKVTITDLSALEKFTYSFDGINSVPAKTSVTDILKRETSAELIFKSRPSFMSADGLTGAEKGTATHKFMEYCNFEAAVNNLEEEIERLYEWEYISEKEAEAIDRESVGMFFKSYAFGLILKAKEVYREYRFITDIPVYELNEEIENASDEFSVVQGVADCVIVNEDSIAIIDYKTDSSTDESYYKKEYSRQLQLYSKALSQIFKKPVEKCILYSFKMQNCIEI